jgi:hypothetical protein
MRTRGGPRERNLVTDSSEPQSRSRLASTAVLGVPVVVAVVAWTVGAVRLQLWRDEYATTAFSSLGVGDLARAVRHVDALLAPYYVLMHAVHLLGASGAGLRVPSVIAAAATVLVTALLARRWWGDAAGLVAGFALVLNPLFAQLALDARPYALTTLCTVLSTLLLERALDRSTTGRWVGYWALLTAAGLLHPFAVLVAGAQLVLVLGRRSGFRPFAAAVAGALVVLAPLALVARGQSGQVGWISRPSPFRAVGTLGNVLDYQTSGRVTVLAVLFGVVVVASAVLAAIRSWRAPRDGSQPVPPGLVRIAFAVALLIVPWLLLLLASWVVVPVLTTHYLDPSTVAVALLLAAGSAALSDLVRSRQPSRFAPVAGATAVVVLSVLLLGPTTRAVTFRSTFQDDFRGLADTLTTRAKAGDGLAVVQKFSQTGLAVGVAHATGDEAYLHTLLRRLPVGAQPLVDERLINGVRPWHTAALAGAAATPSRMWVIATGGLTAPDVAAMLKLRGCHIDPGATQQFGELELSRLGCGGRT